MILLCKFQITVQDFIILLWKFQNTTLEFSKHCPKFQNTALEFSWYCSGILVIRLWKFQNTVQRFWNSSPNFSKHCSGNFKILLWNVQDKYPNFSKHYSRFQNNNLNFSLFYKFQNTALEFMNRDQLGAFNINRNFNRLFCGEKPLHRLTAQEEEMNRLKCSLLLEATPAGVEKLGWYLKALLIL